MVVVQGTEGASVASIAKHQPKRRRRSVSEDQERFGKQCKELDERRRKELAKNSPFRNRNDGASSLSEGISAIKSLRRKFSSGV